jgi:hypothetical protein
MKLPKLYNVLKLSNKDAAKYQVKPRSTYQIKRVHVYGTDEPGPHLDLGLDLFYPTASKEF